MWHKIQSSVYYPWMLVPGRSHSGRLGCSRWLDALVAQYNKISIKSWCTSPRAVEPSVNVQFYIPSHSLNSYRVMARLF